MKQSPSVCIKMELLKPLLKSVALMLGRHSKGEETWVFEDLFQMFLIQPPKALHDEEELVVVVAPGEEGLTREEFNEDAPYCPDIYSRSIGIPNTNLWRAIPPGHHVR